MEENQLNALAFLHINNDIKLDYSQVINQFAKENRYLNLKQIVSILCLFLRTNKFRKSILQKLDFRKRTKCVFLGVILQSLFGHVPRSPENGRAYITFHKTNLCRHAIVTNFLTRLWKIFAYAIGLDHFVF